jgi:hypothetical protein
MLCDGRLFENQNQRVENGFENIWKNGFGKQDWSESRVTKSMD